MTDDILENKIDSLQNKIILWAQKHKIRKEDYHFISYLNYYDSDPPEFTACITILLLEGELLNMFNQYNDLLDEFDKLIDETEFYYEHVSYNVLTFHCNDDKLNKYYLDYFEWQWFSELIKPDYTSLYQELYGYLKKNPEKFYSLEPRKFEILINEIFRNQGYYTELGPGWNDGGIDIKLYHKDKIDTITTLVQIKRYKKSLPIGLEAVSSLSGIVHTENADKGLFITTSRYLPSAKKFANRKESKLTLADPSDITKWCKQVKTKIVRDQSLTLKDEYILNLINSKNGLEGEIVVAQTGTNCIKNEFCLILKDTPCVSLLMKIPSETVKYYDPPYNWIGEEVPLLNESILKYKNKENVFRAQKNIEKSSGNIYFWGNKKLYSIWDKKPVFYNLLD